MTKLLNFCKKNGIKRIKLGDFEADFAEIRLKEKTKIKKEKPRPITQEPIQTEPLPTEDELLFWSTNYDPKEDNQEHIGA